MSSCKPAEDILRQPIEQERLLNQVTTQIRQSLELPIILSTAVEQVRQFLQVDRLLIYQFEPLETENQAKRLAETGRKGEENSTPILVPGKITYEARASDAITSVLNISEEQSCFIAVPNHREKYRKGFIQMVTDTEVLYQGYPCLLKLMRQHHIRSKLVVPIVVKEELWGLLIVNHGVCREWQPSERQFLVHIAEHLSIAIYQAQLYAQLQQQKQTLEKRVSERTQELYDALQAVESANHTKSEFLATMSHELRTPLTCVIGISATLMRWSFGEDGSKRLPPEKQQAYLKTIHDSGQQLLELINGILDLSQVEAGKTLLKISEFSLSKLAAQVLNALKEEAALNNIQLGLERTIDPTRDRFAADENRIKKILFNLISNAIKFTPKAGEVKLRLWVEGNQAVFQVEDTGIGISPEQRTLLFQKFQQLDSPYRRQYKGMGLGLALTKQLVELHGGTIEVESTPNVGSTFTVRIPAQDLGEKTKKRKEATHELSLFLDSSTLQSCIVLIEENEESATLICDILTAAGCQVVWMIDGSTALTQIELLQPIIVIVDLRLLSSREIIHRLQSQKQTRNLKILALIQDFSTAQNSNIIGVDSYLLQPIQPEHLLNKISELLLGSE